MKNCRKSKVTTLIYSSEKIKGLTGRFLNPKFFKEVDVSAKLVYTDDKTISDGYKDIGIKVKPISKDVK